MIWHAYYTNHSLNKACSLTHEARFSDFQWWDRKMCGVCGAGMMSKHDCCPKTFIKVPPLLTSKTPR